jgi:CHAT domain-containing protein/pimeloyl-ACP methyl ester carboxylesterase
MAISTIFIQGEEIENPSTESESTDLQLVAEYRIGGFTRGPADEIPIDLKNNNVVEFEFEDDSLWLSDPEGMEELFPEAMERQADGSVILKLPPTIEAEGQERGLFKNIALKILRLFTKKAIGTSVKALAEKLEDKVLDGNIGLFHLNDDFTLGSNVITTSENPYLVFLHGTAASTQKSFDKLKETTQWRDIRAKYGEDNILALQHRSLTLGPLVNVKDMVEQLPQTATLHLVSHSRGGLVGEILNRFCMPGGNGLGFSENELNYLRKHERTHEVDLIREIGRIVQAKNIKVEKFIRVACGASGTTLASKRLDHVLNVLFNLIGLVTGGVIFIAFKNLLSEVVKSKNDVNILPGLEVQSPDCPFIEMLNNRAPEAEITTPLIIISGNAKGFNSIKRALAVIVTRLFFGGPNDFVIDTPSMYNGAMRAANRGQFFFDQGGHVSHFMYFHNDRTRDALLLAVQNTGETPIPGFLPLKRDIFDTEIRQAALKAIQFGAEFRDDVTGKRPIAVLLPGIMGSNLTVKDSSVWINYRQFLLGGLTRLEYSENNNRNVKATSLVRTSYHKLAEFLSQENYDVVTFPFDWRLPLNESAKALNDKLSVLMSHRQPIKLIGHSMGGVLLRDFIIQHPQTWEALNKIDGFRLLFLGAPLGGSFRIPYVLFGQDEIIKTLGRIDLRNTRKELIQVFNNLPGLLCLLPFSKDPANDFAKLSTWKNMRDKFEDTEWPLPSQAVLDAFGDYRDDVLSKMNKIDFKNAVYIAGQNGIGKQTPLGYRFNDQGKLVFLSTRAGDESVTWDTGIPSGMKAETVYFSDVSHGELANEKRLFKPIAEILSQGKTDILKNKRPALRDADVEFVAKPSFNFDLSEAGVERSIMGLKVEEIDTQTILPISVSVSNGDLKYAAFPVLAGHFYNDGIFSAERAIDKYLNGELSRRLQLGLYPGEIGSNKILIAEGAQQPHFKGAIIAGLGLQGALSPFQLMRTIEQSTASYLTGFNSKEVAIPQPLKQSKQTMGISALIIGCGYGGLSIESSVRATIQGVQNANNKIRQIYDSTAIIINEIEFIELLQDRALSCVHAISSIEKDEDRTLSIAWKNRKVKRLPGIRERLPVDNTSEWWTRINVRQIEFEEDNNTTQKRGLRFTVSTGAARESERFIYTGRETIMQLLDQMGTHNQWSPELAKTIFELLIPFDFKEQIKRQNNINWIVDKNTAMYPWELLQDSTTVNTIPLSVSTGMIRQLATQDFRININPVMGNTALVIGEPDLEDKRMALPSALEEAKRVSTLLTANGFPDTVPLLRSKAAEILVALFSKEYKIVHMCGHGVFNADPKEPTGMLIGKNAYLTTNEISQMSTVPELVFVNCCHLGATNAEVETLRHNRYKLAANIGTQLIEIGVKAVVVAGWAVDDTAAMQFAEEFYKHLFSGDNFGDAIRKARRVIYQNFGHRTNTWGAYQCYGDPFYTLGTQSYKPDQSYYYVIAEEAEIDLTNLLNHLDTGGYEIREMVKTIEAIVKEVDKKHLRNPKITELEAMLYAGLNQYETAIAKFSMLLSGKSSFSGIAIETYCNVRPKFYVSQFKKNPKLGPELADKTEKVINELKAIQSYGETAERLNLLGSAYKRKAQLISDIAKKTEALSESANYYYRAMELASKTIRFYPLCNWLSIENALVLAGLRKWNDKKTKITRKNAIADLQAECSANEENIKSIEETDYWQLVADANLRLCLLQLDDSNTQYEQVLQSYTYVWNYLGHLGNRRDEIAHLEFLEHILSMDKGGKTKNSPVKRKVLKRIQDLRAQLELLNTA